MKKLSLLAVTVLAMLPVLAVQAFATSGHISAGVRNYPLIIACVVGGAFAVFVLALFAMKHKRPGSAVAEEVQTEETENE